MKPALELRHLRAFVAVAEAEHVTRAATRLRVAQPALTRTIQQLEAALGVALLARAGRGVRLTAAGRAFLDDARALLAQTAAAVARARDVHRGAGGVLRVGFVEIASASGLLPEAVRRLLAAVPAARVELRELTSAGQVAELQAGELDAGFVCARAVGRGDALAATTVVSDPLVAVLPPRHPLASARRVTLPDLAREVVLLVRRQLAPALHADVVAAFSAAGAPVERVQEVSQFQTIVQLAAAGVGVGLVPRSVAARAAGATARRVVGLTARHRTELVRRAGPADALLTQFIEICRRTARELRADAPEPADAPTVARDAGPGTRPATARRRARSPGAGVLQG